MVVNVVRTFYKGKPVYSLNLSLMYREPLSLRTEKWDRGRGRTLYRTNNFTPQTSLYSSSLFVATPKAPSVALHVTYRLCFIGADTLVYQQNQSKGKGKAIPLQAWTDP
jgi:hypothetical protein